MIAVRPDSCILFGDTFYVVVGVPCYGVIMLIVDAARDCCALAASRGAFGCADAPGRIVTFSGDAIAVRFA